MTTFDCRHCGHALSGHTAPQDFAAVPNEGDVSVCLYCGTLAQFRNGTFVPPDDLAELESWVRDELLVEALYLALVCRRQLKAKEN